MSEWKVYKKDGTTAVCVIKRLKYNGEWLGACSVMVTITSPTPLLFSIGDYLVYRDERFEINYDPTVIKSSTSGTYGEGFTYDNVKFNSLSDELTRCDFLDYVPDDNLVHYSSLPNFSFFADSVRKLAERIQVNLDRIYKDDKKWTVEVSEDFTANKDVNITVNNLTCWDALAMVKTQFDTNFKIRNRTITIGSSGIAVGNIFSYGKGNGLITIERNAESEQKIITRLRAYGSTRNMPESYYKHLGMKVYIPVDEYTLLENSVTFEIGASYNNLNMFSTVWEEQGIGSYTPYKVSVRLNEVAITAMVALNEDDIDSYINVSSSYETDSGKIAQFISDLNNGYNKLYFESGVDKEAFPYTGREYLDIVPNNMAVRNLMLPSFPNDSLDPYIDSNNIDELGVREGTVSFDGSGDLEEIYPSMEGMTAEHLKSAGIDVDATGNLDEVVSAEQIADDGFYKEGSEIPDFTITLKDIGFNLSTSGNPIIAMKDGMCGAREFEISDCQKNDIYYVLTCKRSYDEDLDLYFPYSDFQINSGDKYVLLNIEMPDVYIQAASQRLLEAAENYLANNDYVRYSYVPKIDNIFMARQHDDAVANNGTSIHDTIKEGDLLLFEDSDLGIEGNITIDTLSIVEGEESIPQYEITLRNDKTVGAIEKIQNQIDSIVQNGAKGSSVDAKLVRSLINLYGTKWFLRKDKEDETEHLLKLLGGAEVGEAIDSMLAGKGVILTPDGRAQVNRLEVRDSAIFREIVYNRLSAQEGDTSYSENGLVESATLEEDGTYTLEIQKRWDNDFTAFKENDILYGNVNNLFESGAYYTSWVRVLSVNTTANTISVVMYGDEEVPGGVNHAPEPLMRLVKRGNAVDTTRQSYWYLSATTEKCFVWLEGVDKPILDEDNYYIMIGRPKNLSQFSNLPLNYEHSYIYARGAIVQDLFRVNFQGDPIKTENPRGFWSLETAQDDPYKNLEYVYDTVSHYGCEWMCLVTGTLQEPKYGSSDWAMLRGNPEFVIEIDSSNGWFFDVDLFDTTLIIKGKLYNQDVTDNILPADVSWTRDTGNTTEDNAWAIKTSEKINANPSLALALPLTIEDLGTDYVNMTSCKFKCTALLRDGQQVEVAENYVTF